MSKLTQAVVFRLDGQRYALPLAAVERIVRAVEVTPVPGAPARSLDCIFRPSAAGMHRTDRQLILR